MSVTNRKDDYTKVSTWENGEKTETNEAPAQYGYGIRHIQMSIAFICFCVLFIARGHIGVTIVAMTSDQQDESMAGNFSTNITDVYATMNSTEQNIGPNDTIVNDTIGKMEDDVAWTIYRTYDWSKPIQETALSSFFFGYCITMVPMALVCQRWGGKVPLQIALLINGLISIITPWLTLLGGWKALCICRIAQGLSQAGTFPGIQTLLARWVPVSERATMCSFVYTGSTIGNIIGFQLSGFLTESVLGWPGTYWAVGVLCITCFVFLTVFGAATPLEHKTISQEERNFIMGQMTSTPQTRGPAPWKAILTSRPVWANVIAHAGSGATYVFILNQIPSFIHYIRGVNVKSSGLLSSLPYMASFFTTIAYGLLSDYLTNKKILGIKTARRVFNSVSHVGVAVMLICASFAPSTTIAVGSFVVGMALYTSLHSGWMLNHIDLSPNYSGTLMAVGNTLMNLFIIITPMLVSNIVVDVRNPYQWRTMISIIAGFAFVTNIVFVIFLSVDVQPWNQGIVDEAENDSVKKSKKDIELKQ